MANRASKTSPPGDARCVPGAVFGLRFPGDEVVFAPPSVQASSRLVRAPEGHWGAERHRLVRGDNLVGLRALAPELAGQVHLAYLDPPYNTGGRAFVYRDRFASAARSRATGVADDPAPGSGLRPARHAAWLAMIAERLMALRPLLRADGLVCVSIDDFEVHRLRMVMDAVFGEAQFIAQVVVVRNRGGRDYLPIAQTHEYVLMYGAGPRAAIGELPRVGRADGEDARGVFELRELRNRNPRFHPGNRPNLAYPVWVGPDAGRRDGLREVAMGAREGWAEVLPVNAVGAGSVWRWSASKFAAALVPGDLDASDVVARQRADGGFRVFEKLRKTTTKPRSVWDEPEVRTELGTRELRALLGPDWFDHPKPVELIRRCVAIGCPPDGIVVDPFAGSGTTVEAVVRANLADGGHRRAVVLQSLEPLPPDHPGRALGFTTVADVTRARIAAVAARDGEPATGGLRIDDAVETGEPSAPPR